MEKLKLIFAIFLLLIVVSFATGYGVEQLSGYGKEVTGGMLVGASMFTLFLLLFELFKEE